MTMLWVSQHCSTAQICNKRYGKLCSSKHCKIKNKSFSVFPWHGLY